MKKIILKWLTIVIVLSLILLGIYIALNYYKTNKSKVRIENNSITSSLLVDNNFKSVYSPKITFDDMSISTVNNVTLNILEKNNIKDVPILLKAQRYYIPLKYISNTLGYTLDESKDNISLNNSIHNIELTQSNYTLDSHSGSLRGNLIKKFNENYISISDIEEIFGMISIFDFSKNSITLIPSNVTETTPPSLEDGKNIALMRFEDFTAGDSMLVDKNQVKVKAMADLLYSKGLKFHVSWIPRFKAPTDNIDNDLLSNNNIQNVGFVNLLDYLINKGGKIGLHGYTHQYGDSRSAVGVELSKDVNNTEEKTRKVIENAIDTASGLNIPTTYFETPHYTDTTDQQKIIEDYFQLIYEPYDYTKKNIYKTNNNLYIPTALGYVENNNYSNITNSLIKKDPKILQSFFYHPSIEVDYMDYNTDNNRLNVTFKDNSPLKNIIKVMEENNYVTIHVDELKKK
ncbi:DUF2334 domain-containing protein [Clostridium sp. LP20]|uniref:DUF2334 domain-containing protein n=1 Tax=Clostridium sp. LP20 TaxID=3418665 RepID=UPI003EE612DC